MRLKTFSRILTVFVLAAAVRVGIIFYERRQPAHPPDAQAKPEYTLTADDNVYRRKIFAYDLKSASAELEGKTVWVSAGNQIPYFPYNPTSRKVDFDEATGFLAPLEEIQIRELQLLAPTNDTEIKQAMAIFQPVGSPSWYAFSIGAESGGNFQFTVNDTLFLDDPHKMYKHWPANVWAAIDHREVKPGMNELQAGFALGARARISNGSYGNRTVEYTNAGKAVSVTFVNNHAMEIK